MPRNVNWWASMEGILPDDQGACSSEGLSGSRSGGAGGRRIAVALPVQRPPTGLA